MTSIYVEVKDIKTLKGMLNDVSSYFVDQIGDKNCEFMTYGGTYPKTKAGNIIVEIPGELKAVCDKIKKNIPIMDNIEATSKLKINEVI